MKRSILSASLLLATAPAPAVAAPAPQSSTEVVAPPAPDADALASEMRVLADHPNDVGALVSAGELALKLGDTTAAARFFARADKIDPRNARLKAGTGSMLVRLERPGEALRLFADAETLGLDPRSYAADRGLAYDLIGQQGRAQHDYRLALDHDRDDETVRRYALSLAISGKTDQALALLDPLLRKTDRGAWRARAFILAMSGDAKGADKIATSMLPADMAAGLAPFFAKLPTLSAADRAFAVNFGELYQTPQRIADARMTPPLSPFRDDSAPIRVASAAPAPPKSGKQTRRDRERQERDPRRSVQLAATTQPRQNSNAVASKLAPVTQSRASTSISPVERPASLPPATRVASAAPRQPAAIAKATAPLTMVQPVPDETKTTPPPPAPAKVAAAEPPPSSEPTRGATGPAPTESSGAAETALATPAESVSTPTLPTLKPSPALASAAAPTPSPTEVATPTPAASPLATSTPTPVPTPSVSPLVAAPPTELASKAPDTSASLTAIPGASAAVSRPPPVGTAPKDTADSILARIVANIDIPSSELGVAPMPSAVPAQQLALADTTPVTIAPPRTETAPKVAGKVQSKPVAKEAEKPSDKKAVEKPAKKPDKKVEKKKVEPEPSRIWVQVAGGANKGDLDDAWTRASGKAPAAFKGKQAWTTPLRFTNRLLTGPFKSSDDAQDFVNAIAKDELSGFIFTSDAGQKIDKLSVK